MSGERFDEWVPGHSRQLLRTAWLLTGDAGLAEDLVQTALLRCWQRWSRIQEMDNSYAYVQRVMTRLFLAGWRRKWRGEVPTEEIPDMAVADDSWRIADRASTRDALRRLPAGQQAAVVLKFAEDREAQTAELLGCSVGSVKRQVHRGLRSLRQDAQLLQEAGQKTGGFECVCC